MQNKGFPGAANRAAIAALVLMAGAAWQAEAARKGKADETAASGAKTSADVSDAEAGADRLIKAAEDYLAAKENERGIKMLETVIERFPEAQARFRAHLALGRHYVENRRDQEALKHLRHLLVLEKGDEATRTALREVLIEGLYLSGVAYYQSAQYSTAFPVLRKITRDYPNTVWANQAYYYVGMCHFMQGNWQKAIEALSLVGTFVDPTAPTLQYMEAGRRFYAKIEDPDLPILNRLGKKVSVLVETAKGDREVIECIPLAGKGEIFIGSAPTEIGVAKAGDGILQVLGGDTATATYLDDNTQDGQKDVPRKAQVKVVSTAAMDFTLGTFESRAVAAFVGQPVFLSLQDADLDATTAADRVSVKVISRYRDFEAEEAAKDQMKLDVEKLLRGEAELRKYRTRDEAVVTLTEAGTGTVVRSGVFTGSLRVVGGKDEKAADKSDGVLACGVGDEIVASYVDALHLGGEAPREVVCQVAVAGELENRPMATQYVVTDPVVRTKKNLVEASAYLELGRIFKSMGLTEGAKQKCDVGLSHIDSILRSSDPIPGSLREEAFRSKWELEMVKENFDAAIATCQVFNKLFPDSPIVDQALLGIGRIHLERKDFGKAMGVFQQILALPKSLAKAEAQFRIAESIEQQAAASAAGGRGAASADAAIPHYKLCAERYPDSEFAGTALGKLVDYYVESKDYAQAEDLLNQIFQDHPDARFLDGMLLKWVIVAYRMGNYDKAHGKCKQLLFDYPNSQFAEKAKSLLPRIEEKLKGPSPSAPAGESAESKG